jgi:hypothetical protein
MDYLKLNYNVGYNVARTEKIKTPIHVTRINLNPAIYYSGVGALHSEIKNESCFIRK